MNLSILCITKAEPHSFDFLEYMAEACDELQASLVVVADGTEACSRVYEADIKYDLLRQFDSLGYLESIYDEALALCDDGYVLRLDDDEYIGPEFVDWLKGGFYTGAPVWKFARAHIWTVGEDEMVITSPPLWPDVQTRLGKKQYMGGRNTIHCGNPSGGGDEAPVYLEHHCFLVRTREEREAKVARYDSIAHGAGTCFRAFSVPETEIPDMRLAPLGNGYTESIK